MTTMSAKLSGSLFRTKIPGKSHLDASGFSCGSCFRSFHCLALIIFIFLLSFCLSGCKARHSKMPPAASNGVLPRPDPSYIAWLEQQSMLGMAPDLAAQVSGSGRAYGSRGGAGRVEVLLNAAPNWLWINPLEVGGGNPVFRQIINKNIVSAMKGYGLEGLFLAPLGESGAIWSSRAGARDGWDVASLSFSAEAGSENDYSRLVSLTEDAGIQPGGELPPAATGLGPDFMLQARCSPRHNGLYAMIQVPQKNWGSLPPASGEWEGCALDGKDVESLSAAGILPEKFARDKAKWPSTGGWAATGEIMGADGKMRRWLYRHAKNPSRPVMLWQDPSGEARNVFSAAIIQQTGLRGQTLTGIRMEPLFGLEAGEEASLEPGLEALEALTREIHRYGGWAMQDDPLPVSIVAKILSGSIDFCVDAETEAASRKALASGNANMLAEVLRKALKLKIPMRRTARGVQQDDDSPSIPEFVFRNLKFRPSDNHKENKDFAEAWNLGLAMRIGLPGLAMFTPADLGLTWFDAPASGSASRPPDKNLLLARKKSGLAAGKFKSVHGGQDGWLAIVSELPDGGYWLTAANYSAQNRKATIRLPSAKSHAIDAATGMEVENIDGQKVEIALEGHQARHLIFYGK